MTPSRRAAVARIGLGALLTAAFGWIVLRDAWVAEDAYITLRTVDNFVHGYGLRWNVAERVQAYTHPLWMLVLAAVYAVTREDFRTLLFTCAALSLVAFALVQRLATTALQAVACAALLGLSPAFVDFSTSGLENALTHLLLAAFALVYFADARPSLRRLALIAALTMVNRLDVGLLVLPALAFATARAPGGWRDKAAALAVGLSPLVAWELFALAYYGFLLPNTAYAKLDTGIPARELVQHGLGYFASHATADPLTLAALAVGLALGLASRDTRLRLVALGIALYLAYLLRIGGDFMLGRFLTPPLFAAALVLARSPLLRARAVVALPLAAAVIAVGLLAPRTPLRAPLQPKPSVDAHGLADERLIYAEHASLAARRPGVVLPDHHWAEAGRALRKEGRAKVLVSPNVGYLGYFAGPLVHIIDANALTDPLLARLPIAKGPWRIGHFTRDVPDGYEKTVESGTNQLRDRTIARLYDELAVVTRGPLWRWKRLVAIVRLNARR